MSFIGRQQAMSLTPALFNPFAIADAASPNPMNPILGALMVA